MELAVYSADADAFGLDFTPNHEAGATVTNSFKLVTKDGVIPGRVEWSEAPARPWGALTQNCPDGDATGEELDACTLWQGVIYAVEADGAVVPLPAQGKPAPKRLILSGLGPMLAGTERFRDKPAPSTDVFELSGCQE